MINFFRDVLDGPLYIATTILSVIFIMAIIGFLMERRKLEKETKEKIAIVNTPVMNTPKELDPITPVSIETEREVIPASMNPAPISNLVSKEETSSLEVKQPAIVFDDTNQKTE